MATSAHQALQNKFGGEWNPLHGFFCDCYGDESSSRVFVVLNRYCEAYLDHHNSCKSFMTRLKHIIGDASNFGIGQDDMLTLTGRSCTLVSAKGFLVGLFNLFVSKERKRTLKSMPKLDLWSHINKYIGFACRAVTSEVSAFHVSLMQDAAVTLKLGANGEVFGLESLLQYVPNLRAYWEAARETPVIEDDTCICVNSDFSCARCADLILLLSTLVGSSGFCDGRDTSSPSVVWTHICIPILRALFTQLSELFNMQTWRSNAVGIVEKLQPRIDMPGRTRNPLTDTELMGYIRIFRKNQPIWIKNEATTKHLKHRLKIALGLTYLEQIPAQFKGSSHFCVSFDPGLHSRQESLGLIVTSPDGPVPYLMAYGPVIVIRKVPVSAMQSQLVLDLIEEGQVSVCFYISFEISLSTVPLST